MSLLSLIKSFFCVKDEPEYDGNAIVERDSMGNIVKRIYPTGFTVRHYFDLLNREVGCTATNGYSDQREYHGVSDRVKIITCHKNSKSWIEHYTLDGERQVEYVVPE